MMIAILQIDLVQTDPFLEQSGPQFNFDFYSLLPYVFIAAALVMAVLVSFALVHLLRKVLLSRSRERGAELEN